MLTTTAEAFIASLRELAADETRTWCGTVLTFNPANPASEHRAVDLHEADCTECQDLISH